MKLRYEPEIPAVRHCFVMEFVRGIKMTEYCDKNMCVVVSFMLPTIPRTPGIPQ